MFRTFRGISVVVDMLPWVAFAAFLGAVEVGLGQVDREPVA